MSYKGVSEIASLSCSNPSSTGLWQASTAKILILEGGRGKVVGICSSRPSCSVRFFALPKVSQIEFEVA